MHKKNGHEKLSRHGPQAKPVLLGAPEQTRTTIAAMQRQINTLKRSLAQKEHEVWTLKQLLLYR